MGRKTKIDWCDSSWNPVTGCLHGCEYCYARNIARRFRGYLPNENPGTVTWVQRREGRFPFDSSASMPVVELTKKQVRMRSDGKIVPAPYPIGFLPTLHRYKLDEPQGWMAPRSIFVCSMADLFGECVPDTWIRAVIDACYAAPQHRYLFLSKNPKRYADVIEYLETSKGISMEGSPDLWFGTTVTTTEQLERAYDTEAVWLSIEPIQERIATDMCFVDERNYGFGECEFGRWKWVVIGAETGNRKNKVVPEKDWIMEIVEVCEILKTPIFMKESIRGIMGDDFRQEFPWR